MFPPSPATPPMSAKPLAVVADMPEPLSAATLTPDARVIVTLPLLLLEATTPLVPPMMLSGDVELTPAWTATSPPVPIAWMASPPRGACTPDVLTVTKSPAPVPLLLA